MGVFEKETPLLLVLPSEEEDALEALEGGLLPSLEALEGGRLPCSDEEEPGLLFPISSLGVTLLDLADKFS